MQELIEYIVKSVVSDKETVTVSVEKTSKCNFYTVNVAQSDLGAVIGKGGKIAEAIRTVVKSASNRERLRIKFEAK